MAAQRHMRRLGVISAGTAILGMAASGAAHADEVNCDGRGGLITTTTDEICRSLDATASGLQGAADGATGGATSGFTAGARRATGQAAGMVNDTAGRIDGTQPTPRPGTPPGRESPGPDKGDLRPPDRAKSGIVAGRPFVARPLIAGPLPLGGLGGADPGEETTRLPEIALAPQVARPYAIESATNGVGLRWVIVAAAGSGLAGLVGGGHLGLLTARVRRRHMA